MKQKISSSMMVRILLVSSFLIFTCTYAKADSDSKKAARKAEREARRKKLESKSVQYLAIFMFNSVRVYRGALIWPDPTIFPGIGFIFWNHIRLAGPNITFYDTKGPLSFGIGVNWFNDDLNFIKIGSHENNFRNQRRGTLNSYAFLEGKFLDRKLRFRLEAHQDLKVFKGQYYQFSGSFPILPFTSLGAVIDYGGSANNTYIFGKGAKKGIGQISPFGQIVFPFLPWHGVLIARYRLVKTFHHENKNASFVRPDDNPKVFTLMTNWRF